MASNSPEYARDPCAFGQHANCNGKGCDCFCHAEALLAAVKIGLECLPFGDPMRKECLIAHADLIVRLKKLREMARSYG